MAPASPSTHTAQTLMVELERDPYPVRIGQGELEHLGQRLRQQGVAAGTRVLLVTNPDVERHHGAKALASLRQAELDTASLVLEAGEEHKTPATVGRIHDAAYAHRLERGSLIVALGGGVVGDMAGFAAATWLRGIAVAQVPTTLLAMVDAAIGGKTGVNHPGGKNLIGAFHQPRLVLIDPLVLATLPQREFRAGMAEVIKYGVIGDATLFRDLEAACQTAEEVPLGGIQAVGAALLQHVLERSVAAKARVVAADEREGGLRAILNYGHTIGHVVETLTGYGTWLHGEAVALGMLAAGNIALAMGLWGEDDQARQRALIQAAGLPVRLPELDEAAVLACLQADKKVQQGRLRFVLPHAIGAVSLRDDVDAATIQAAMARLR
ncbi:MAG: 3-dehydroquinate synthase [Cyanobacteriota bacterium]|nr:3-dehydroquinate synthase [Cyanobacteriota bacterium]